MDSVESIDSRIASRSSTIYQNSQHQEVVVGGYSLDMCRILSTWSLTMLVHRISIYLCLLPFHEISQEVSQAT